MQNRYVGDIGDYVKLAILRKLAGGRSLGVAWWMFPDESHNCDGGHREYLDRPSEWRRFDPDLFDALSAMNKDGIRDVRSLERPFLLLNALFAREFVSCKTLPVAQRPARRSDWLKVITNRFRNRNLIFVDPDNGIASERLRPTSGRAGKSVFITELQELRISGRAIVVYHHHGRPKGGHGEELRDLVSRLRDAGFSVCGALRAKPWSPRAFFILDGDEELRTRAREIAKVWDPWISWYPNPDTEGVAIIKGSPASLSSLGTPS